MNSVISMTTYPKAGNFFESTAYLHDDIAVKCIFSSPFPVSSLLRSVYTGLNAVGIKCDDAPTHTEVLICLLYDFWIDEDYDIWYG